MPKPKEYGSPLGTPEPSKTDAGRPKVKDPDASVVRAALGKASTRMPTEAVATKLPRGSSVMAKKVRERGPPVRTDAEIERQSR